MKGIADFRAKNVKPIDFISSTNTRARRCLDVGESAMNKTGEVLILREFRFSKGD